MKITMTETRCGSPNGFKVKRYHTGLIYDVPHTLACTFLRNRWAVVTEELSSNAAYARIMMDIGNKSLAKEWGWI